MLNSLGLPFTFLESVESVSRLNDYIRTYSDKSKVLTPEEVRNVFAEYDGNIFKYLQVAYAMVQNMVARKSRDCAGTLFESVRDILDSIQPEEIQPAVNGLTKIIQYLADQPSVPNWNDYAQDFRNLRSSLYAKSMKAPSDTSASQLEGMFDMNSGADIQFAAVLDAMLEVCNETFGDILQTESAGAVVRKIKDKATTAVTKFTLRDKEMSEQLNEKFNRYLQEYKENRKVATYDKIVKDSFNLSRMLKTLIGSSIVALLVPGGVQAKVVAAVLTILAKFALDKRTQDKHKKVVLADLKFERTVLQEKIKDADSKGDTAAKYQLMRTENEISRAIDRVTMGLANN